MGRKVELQIDIQLEEDTDHTEAEAMLELAGERFVGRGRARRNPVDANRPVIGEELATARALSDLSRRLLDAATDAIADNVTSSA